MSEGEDRPWAAPRPLFYVSVGDRGLSLSWQGAAALIVAVAAGVALFNKLALKADIEDHEAARHRVALEDRREPVELRALAAEHHRKLDDVARMAEEQRRLGQQVDRMRAAIFEDRADELADEAAEQVRPRARKAAREHVRARAIANQEAGRPIREGLEGYLGER